MGQRIKQKMGSLENLALLSGELLESNLVLVSRQLLQEHKNPNKLIEWDRLSKLEHEHWHGAKSSSGQNSGRNLMRPALASIEVTVQCIFE